MALVWDFRRLFEPVYSPHGCGSGRGRRAQDAVEAAQDYIREGCTWALLTSRISWTRSTNDKAIVRVAEVQ